MLKFAADLTVNRPVEQVFAGLTNAENQGKFDTSSLKMEAFTPGPWQAGTQFRELRDLGGRKIEVLSEVAELEPNRRFDIRSRCHSFCPATALLRYHFPDHRMGCFALVFPSIPVHAGAVAPTLSV
jgi:hypothetical protein